MHPNLQVASSRWGMQLENMSSRLDSLLKSGHKKLRARVLVNLFSMCDTVWPDGWIFFSIFCHWKQWKFAQQPIFFLTIDKSITVYVERFYDKIGFGWISLKVLLFHFSGVLSGSVEGTGTSLVHLHFRFQTTSARFNIQQRSPNICFPNGKFLG